MSIDVRGEPFISLETLQLDREISGERNPEVLMTFDQLADVYGELQDLVRWRIGPPLEADGSMRWGGMTLRPVPG